MEDLSQQLRRQIESYPRAIHSIIAHSHGGNVALGALRHEDIESHIERVVCLNTPFLCPLRRSLGSVIRGPAFLLILLACLVGYPILRAVVDVQLGRTISGGMLVIEEFVTIALFGCFLWLIVRIGWLAKVRVKRDKLIGDLALPVLHRTKITCLWSASDEVFDIYQLLDIISNLPYLFLRLEVILLVWLLAMVGQWVGWVGPFPGLQSIPLFGNLILDGQLVWKTQSNPFGLLVASFYSGALYSVAFLVLTEVFAALWNALRRPMGIGWLSGFETQYVRLVVLPTPIAGRDIEFEDFDGGTMLLNHTAIYNDQKVLERLASVLLTDRNQPRG